MFFSIRNSENSEGFMLNRNDEHVSVSTAAPSFTSNTEKDLKFCMAEKRPDPCILVIIGASGEIGRAHV